MKRYIYKIEKDGYKFVYNHNSIKNSKYPYMIHIYNPKGSCVFYQNISWEKDTTWTYEYMDKWFDEWLGKSR